MQKLHFALPTQRNQRPVQDVDKYMYVADVIVLVAHDISAPCL